MISLPLIVGCSLLLFVAYQYIIFPIFVSPLSNIPAAHFTSSFSPGWMLWQRKSHRENRAILAAHQRCGPVVRLGPNEISINCVEGGIRTVYGSFERHNWYTNAFQNYGYGPLMLLYTTNYAYQEGRIPNMVTIKNGKQHSERKRMLSNVYSKSYIQNLEEMKKLSAVIIYDRFLPILHSSATAGTPVEVLELATATTMDFSTAYMFGLSRGTNFLGDAQYREHWIQLYCSPKPYAFWQNELPTLGRFLRNINVFPPFIDHARGEIENWCLELCQAAAAGTSQTPDHDTTDAIVYNQLASRIAKSDVPTHEKTRVIASEMMDQIIAGAETSAVTLTYLMHELSSRPSIQAALRTELLTLSPPIHFPPPGGKPHSEGDTLPSSRTVDELPLLDAIITETLRLHSVNPGPQPRVTPPSTSTIGGYGNIPGGVRVSANAYTLHRNPDVFPSPLTWDPHRWLDASEEAKREMNRWFWAFSSGGRMCIGLHLALHGTYRSGRRGFERKRVSFLRFG